MITKPDLSVLKGKTIANVQHEDCGPDDVHYLDFKVVFTDGTVLKICSPYVTVEYLK